MQNKKSGQKTKIEYEGGQYVMYLLGAEHQGDGQGEQ